MHTRSLARAIAFGLALSIPSLSPAAAQTGSLRGTVVDAANDKPLLAASVLITSRRDPGLRVVRLAGRDGSFAVADLAAGLYEVRASHVGYGTSVIDEVEVRAGESVVVSLTLVEEEIAMKTVVVSASRREEKALDAPASIQVIDGDAIEHQAVLTPADHLKALPGVDVARAGINQGTVVVRGFNNIFSGATLTLVDNRIARVPSLRYNAMNLIPTLNEDIERIEVVSGPGSALYGPNAANGVVHILTRSPFDDPGTSLSVSGGEQDVLMASARHAGAPSDQVGYKIGVMYYRGEDFMYRDPVEEQERADAIADGADPATLKIGLRDFDVDKITVDGRVDIYPSPQTQVLLGGGFNQLNAIELTGLGAAQAKNWQNTYGQIRVGWNDLFWQAYYNRSDAGDAYNLRTGADFVDQSSFFVTQFQHQWRPSDREALTYGADVLRTRPDTKGTINGRNEEDDDINEFGAYVQSETELHEQWQLTAAARFDDNNRLKDPVFSPRAALVFEAAPGHKVRTTYNRAFSTPTPNNYFLDLVVLGDLGDFGAATGGAFDGFDLLTKGVPEGGFTFRRDAGGGIDGLYMQTPAALQAIAQAVGSVPAAGPADATVMWPAVQAILLSNGVDITAIPAPPAAGATRLQVLNPTTAEFEEVDPAFVQDVGEMQPTINNTFELGYKGLIGDRFVAQADVWHSRIKDFVGPLRVETPNVFFDPTALTTYLSNPAFGLVPAQVQAIVAGIEGIPVGTIAPENAEDPADLFLTYRNFGDVDLSGIDLALSWFADRHWTFGANYSYATKDFFEDASGISDIALNAPRHKAGALAHYRDRDRGFDVGTRVRFVDTFPVLSGVFVGDVRYYTVVDLSASWEVVRSPGTTLSLLVQNALDNEHREFVGVPELGRVASLRLSQRL